MDELFPTDASQGSWPFDPKRPKPGIFLKELRLMESLEPAVEIRRIEFRPGLNIVWADPKTLSPRKRGSKLSGHSAGKTTFCRLLRWLLGEGRFGRDELHEAVGGAFRAGWAILHLEIAGRSWVTGRAFWDSAKHWAARSRSINEVIQEKPPQGGEIDDFFAQLEEETVARLAQKRLPGLPDPLRWTDLLAWLARDQDAALQTVEAWRASTASIPRNIAAKDSRHTIMRLVLGLLEEEEWREKGTCAGLESLKEDAKKQTPDLEAAASATCDALRFFYVR